MWNKTTDGFPTEEKAYLCIKKNSKQIELLVWNSFYNVWDDSDGDDYNCAAEEVLYWVSLPELPDDLK